MSEQAQGQLDFDARLLVELEKAIATLPATAAELHIGGRQPSDPVFRIDPVNSRAARISGTILGQIDSRKIVVLGIGQRSWREFANKTGSVVKGVSCEHGIRLLCQSVFASRLSEVISYDWQGRPVRSRLMVSVDGSQVVLGSFVIPFAFLPFKSTHVVEYEPYI